MKKQMKRATAVALATAMTMGMSFPAFAAGNGGDRTLVVTGETLDNKKVYAVQMFDARVTAGDSGSNTFDNYELVNAEKWLEFFTAETGAGGMGLTDQDADADVDADDVRAYLEKMTAESTDVKNLADKAQAWVRSHSSDFTVITSDDEEKPVSDKETFTELKAGYYLVYPEGGSTGTGNRGTDAMLVNVPTDANAEWAMKSTFPTVDKKVDTNETVGDTHEDATDNGSAQVGDVVTFTLASAVPDMSDYTTFYFAFNDTLSNGLQVVKSDKTSVADGDNLQIDNLIVTIGGETVTGYTVSLHSGVLKVAFENLKGVTQAAQPEDIGNPIVVTYQAMITEAATTENPADNTVKVEYSNDPTTGTKGESTPDESKVFTYEIDVNKWSTEAGGITGNLAGAEFKLTTDKAGEQVVELIATEDGYRVAKPDEGGVNSFITTEEGDITISGLEAGTYYLHEVAAPEGYNKLKAPITIVITMTNDPEVGDATITVDGEAATGDDGTTVDVENKKGIELPETGSIGTISLTAAGVAIVLAGVLAPRKKKSEQE